MAQAIDAEAILTTERLILEPLRERHARELYPLLHDPRIFRYMPEEPPISAEALAVRYRLWEHRASPNGCERWLNWVVRLASNAQAIGLLQATIPATAPALIAYMLVPAYWGQGLASEGVERIVKLLFDDYGVKRIGALIDTRNAASIALVERLGFRRIATIRGADHFKGAPSDEYRYELRKA